MAYQHLRAYSLEDPKPYEPEEVSPFQRYADAEKFRLDFVESSYKILCSINVYLPNFYKLAEEQAKKNPEMAEKMYKALRSGMDKTPEQFAAIDPMFWMAF